MPAMTLRLDADVPMRSGRELSRIGDRSARAELFYLNKAWYSSNLAPVYFDWVR